MPNLGTRKRRRAAFIADIVRVYDDYARLMIFVFGSNLAGRHVKGAALCALRNHGAIYGQGVGRHGNSYAIPTKDARIRTLPLDRIAKYVAEFLDYARQNPDVDFEITKISHDLAGYKEADIKPMFKGAPANCKLPDWWR
jgi:hypothetical protein